MTVKWPFAHFLATLSMVGPGRGLSLGLDVVGDIGFGTGCWWMGLREVGGEARKGLGRSFRRLGSSKGWGNAVVEGTRGRGALGHCEILRERGFSSLQHQQQRRGCSRRRAAVCGAQQISCSTRAGRSMSRIGGYASMPRSLHFSRCFSVNSLAKENSIVPRERDSSQDGLEEHASPPSVIRGNQPKRLSILRDRGVYWYRSPKLEKKLSNERRDLLARGEQNCALGTPWEGGSGGVAQDNSSSDLTVICFDIETTGFSARSERIIEFAARDLAGGEHSTIETLVNPEKEVRNEHIHNISSQMVNNPGVPKWKDVAPAILDFVDSRRKGQGLVILVAHNGKRFDVPFMLTEFHACGLSLPSYWRFADSLAMARLAMKGSGRNPVPSTALGHLFTYYGLPSIGEAHRAMADVNMLAQVLQMLMNDLQMSTSELLDQSFGADEVTIKDRMPVSSIEEGGNSSEVEIGAAADGERVVDVVKDVESASVPWDSVSARRNEVELEMPFDSDGREFWESEGQHLPVQDTRLAFDVPDIRGLELGPDEQGVGQIARPAMAAPLICETSSVFETQSTISREVDVENGIQSIREDESQEIDLVKGGVQGFHRSVLREEFSGLVSHVSTRGGSQPGLDLEDNCDVLLEKRIDTRNSDDYPATALTVVHRDIRDGCEETLLKSGVGISLINPIIRQCVQVQRAWPRFLVLSQVGDLYKALFRNTKTPADAWNIHLTAVDGGKSARRKITMSGVPFEHLDRELQMLLGKGMPIVQETQVGAQVKGSWREGQASAILRPFSSGDEALPDGSCDKVLLAIMPPSRDKSIWGLAYSQIGQLTSTKLGGTRRLETWGAENSWRRPDVTIWMGPKESKKNFYVRQIGLIQILTQAGSFGPAEKCCLSISDGSYFRIGSVGDLAPGHSSFTAEMNESAIRSDKTSCRSLVRLDDVGQWEGSRGATRIVQAEKEEMCSSKDASFLKDNKLGPFSGSEVIKQSIRQGAAKATTREENIVYTQKDLSEVWSHVCATLQTQPATQALSKQKGVLISISAGADGLCVRVGSSILFVKKFQQYEHATALEAAFTTVLKQPVKIDISVLKPIKTDVSIFNSHLR